VLRREAHGDLDVLPATCAYDHDRHAGFGVVGAIPAIADHTTRLDDHRPWGSSLTSSRSACRESWEVSLPG